MLPYTECSMLLMPMVLPQMPLTLQMPLVVLQTPVVL
jgi:hypothetical protein